MPRNNTRVIWEGCEDQSCDIVNRSGNGQLNLHRYIYTFSRRITCRPDTAEFCTVLGSTAASDQPINVDLQQHKSVRVDNHHNQGAVFLFFVHFFLFEELSASTN